MRGGPTGLGSRAEQKSRSQTLKRSASALFERNRHRYSTRGKLDHVEIYAFQTGSGMAIAPPRADANAKVESRITGEGDTALTPENPGKWAASQERRTGGHAGSRSSRAKPERGKGGPSQER